MNTLTLCESVFRAQPHPFDPKPSNSPSSSPSSLLLRKKSTESRRNWRFCLSRWLQFPLLFFPERFINDYFILRKIQYVVCMSLFCHRISLNLVSGCQIQLRIIREFLEVAEIMKQLLLKNRILYEFLVLRMKIVQEFLRTAEVLNWEQILKILLSYLNFRWRLDAEVNWIAITLFNGK